MAGEPTNTVTLSRLNARLGRAADCEIPRQLGTIRLIREIGRGGMGVVWLGHDTLLDRDVVVKFLLNAVAGADDPEFRLFLDGARAAAAIMHPALNTLYHAAVIAGLPYLVLEYIDGATATEALRAAGPISPAGLVALLQPVCEGLDALHTRGILHRDVKPSNILLARDGRVVLTDFGIACRCKAAGGEFVVGTPAYMAPELQRGEYSVRSDIYALGITAAALLTGHADFGSNHPPSEPRRAVCERRLQARALPTALIDAVLRAIQDQAGFRYKTAAAMRRALHAAAGEPSDSVVRTSMIDWCRATFQRDADDASGLRPEAEGSSYYEALSQRADGRRQARAGQSGHPGLELPRDASGHGSLDASIGVDLHCFMCGYNLRSTARSSNCPECGTPIARSLDAGRLMFRGEAWLRAKASAILWLMIALPGWGVATIMSIFAGRLGTSAAIMTVPPGILAAYLTWKLTNARKRYRCSGRERFASIATRIGLVAWLVAIAWQPVLFQRFIFSEIVLVYLTGAALFIYQSAVLMHVPNKPLARDMRWVASALAAGAIFLLGSEWGLVRRVGEGLGIADYDWPIVIATAILITATPWVALLKLWHTRRALLRAVEAGREYRARHPAAEISTGP